MGNIFIIDNENESVAFLEEVLTKVGHYVEISEDTLDALEKDLPFQPDIILFNLMTFDQSNIETIEKLKNASARNHIGFVVISTLRHQEDFERALKIQANDYLIRPFKSDEIRFRIERQLERISTSIQEVKSSPNLRRNKILKTNINSLHPNTFEISLLAKRKRRVRSLDKRSRRNRLGKPKRYFQKFTLVQMAYLYAAGIAIFVSLFVAGLVPNVINYISRIDPRIIHQLSIYQPKDTERGLKLMRDEILRLKEKKRRSLVQEY